MHTEPRDAVPLRVIAPDKCVFSAGDLPHSLNGKKPACDFLNADPFPIYNLFQVIMQSGTKVLSLSNIYRQATTKEYIYTRLPKGFGRR